MEPEEDNNIGQLIMDNSTYGVLTTTRDYGNYTVTGGGLAVNPYFDNDLHIHRDNSVIPNDKGEMVFPELLFKIIKKNLPGISSIEVDGYINNERLSITNFSSVPSYLVLLNVKFHWDSKDVSTPEKLTESINTAFSMMYTDIDFIKFQVKRIVVEKRDYESEFFSMFMKK
jgi:hypothetical protein